MESDRPATDMRFTRNLRALRLVTCLLSVRLACRVALSAGRTIPIPLRRTLYSERKNASQEKGELAKIICATFFGKPKRNRLNLR